MKKNLYTPLLTALAVLVLAGLTPSSAAAAPTCEEVCAGCHTCKIFSDGGYECTGCPRPTLQVEFTGATSAQISVDLDESLWEGLGFRAAPAGLALAPVPGIFSVDSARIVTSRLGGAEEKTAIFEITLAPGATPEMVLSSLHTEGYFTVSSPNERGEVLIPVEELLSANSFESVLFAE